MRGLCALLLCGLLVALAGCTTRSDWGKNKDYDVPKTGAEKQDAK